MQKTLRQSCNLTSEGIDSILWHEIFRTREAFDTATRKFGAAVSRISDSSGCAAVRDIGRVQGAALEAYCAALREFNAFSAYGRIPKKRFR